MDHLIALVDPKLAGVRYDEGFEKCLYSCTRSSGPWTTGGAHRQQEWIAL